MSHHLSNGFVRGCWLVDASTVTNWSTYFNKLTADIPYISYVNPTKKWNTFKCMNVIRQVRFATKWSHVAIGMNWTVESRSLRLQVIYFWIQPSDSSIQAGFLKKHISESERDVQNTWIPQAEGWEGGWSLTMLHSMRLFSVWVKEDKWVTCWVAGDFSNIHQAKRKLFSCML